MSEVYNQEMAIHYAAYRPPLHQVILNEGIPQGKSYAAALDIGCGTGRSTAALLDFSSQIIGIDPSTDKLAQAQTHPNITYQAFNGKDLPFKDNRFDLITCAGSWYYAKSQLLLDEITRVSTKNTLLVLYDFAIQLQACFQQYDLPSPASATLDYDHEADLSDLNLDHILLQQKRKASYPLEVSPQNLVHLLLSEKDWYHFFQQQWGMDQLEDKLLAYLLHQNQHPFQVPAQLYFTTYICTKPMQ